MSRGTVVKIRANRVRTIICVEELAEFEIGGVTIIRIGIHPDDCRPSTVVRYIYSVGKLEPGNKKQHIR